MRRTGKGCDLFCFDSLTSQVTEVRVKQARVTLDACTLESDSILKQLLTYSLIGGCLFSGNVYIQFFSIQRLVAAFKFHVDLLFQ